MKFFSVEKGPPTKIEIMNEEKALQKKIKKIKFLQKSFFSLTIIIFIFGVGVMFYSPFSAIITIAIGIIIFGASSIAAIPSFVFARQTDNLTHSLNELSDIPKGNCEEALMVCKINSECEKYRQDVIRQGRKITYGELIMMRNLVAPEGVQSYNEARENRLEWACNKLHS